MKSERVKTLSIAAAVVVVFTITAASAAAQTRITFKRGATSAVVTGYLRGYKDHKTFVIHVRKGQVLHTSYVGAHHISVFIEGPRGSGYEQDMAADCHSENEIDPTARGDYILDVWECKKADPFRGRFRLRVTVK